MWPLHPLLFAIYPALALLAHNRHEAKLVWVLPPLVISILIAAVLWALAAGFVQDRARSALLASLTIILFFGFGHIAAKLHGWTGASAEVIGVLVLVSQSALVLGAGLLLYLTRRRGQPYGLTRFANVASLALVLLPTAKLIGFELAAWGQRSDFAGAAETALTHPSESGARPDVYLIVPDAHARSDVMRDLYQHDMEPFLEVLESLGFAVARRSTANYGLTPKSLASMLNFRYLDEYGRLPQKTFRPYGEMIRGSAFVSSLERIGYKTIAFPSGHSYSEMDHFDHYERSPAGGAEFHRLYADLTPLAPLLRLDDRWNTYVSQKDRFVDILRRLPEVAADPEPTFTFVHLALPHPPFRFDERGRDVFDQFRDLEDNGKSGRPEEHQKRYRRAYRGQLAYTDQLLLEAVRRILKESESPPIIILLSDHGPRLEMHWDEPEETDVREAMGNLTAVYFPGGRGVEALYATITPVNVMRVVLNECFGAHLNLLPDRSFLSVNHDGWYRLHEVTERLRIAEEPQEPSPLDPVGAQPGGDQTGQ